MRCMDVTSRLDAYAAGSLPATVRAEVAAHLRTCEACRAALAFDRQFAALARGLRTPAVPDGFVQRVVARAKTTSQTPHLMKRGRHWSTWTRIAAAVVLGAGLALGGLLGRSATLPSAGRAPARIAGGVDGLSRYNLDVLNDTPEGSLADTYLTLLADAGGSRN